MLKKLHQLLESLLTALICTTATVAIADERFDDDRWFDDDLESQSLNVNEGRLTFITPVTDRPILLSRVNLTIEQQSLKSGWVTLVQCYENINAVSTTDIVYRYREIKDLKIVSQNAIDSAQVSGQAVLLKGVSSGASLCVNASIKILEKIESEAGKGLRYMISNGPYHLKFFDGYYPFHLSLTVEYPDHLLSFNSSSPTAQMLFDIKHSAGLLNIDTWFEGELTVELLFNRVEGTGIGQAKI